MKNLLLFSALISFSLFTACEGPSGPPGPPGPIGNPGTPGEPGIPGEDIVSEVYEVEVDFTEADNYQILYDFDPVIYEDDVVLVYIEWTNDEGFSIWRLLPQPVYFDTGILQYNYDFTYANFNLFLDGTIDFSTLPSDYTDNQYFRIVVVPGEFANGRIDFSNYEAVMEILGKTESDLKTLPLKQ